MAGKRARRFDRAFNVAALARMVAGSQSPPVIPASARCWSWSAASFRPGTRRKLLAVGVARVCTPKDDEIQDIMGDLADIAVGHHRAA